MIEQQVPLEHPAWMTDQDAEALYDKLTSMTHVTTVEMTTQGAWVTTDHNTFHLISNEQGIKGWCAGIIPEEDEYFQGTEGDVFVYRSTSEGEIEIEVDVLRFRAQEALADSDVNTIWCRDTTGHVRVLSAFIQRDGSIDWSYCDNHEEDDGAMEYADLYEGPGAEVEGA